jgi:phosphoribosylformylglycinamidine synthase
MAFHPSYRAKPFALGGSIGVIPTALAQKGVPQAGDLVVLLGGLTGNDGIHGASGSSVGAEMDHSSVQIGSPLEEVKFHAGIVALRDAGCLRAITDVGGAGLNSAVGEMGDPCGVLVNTALVPLKTAGLPMWRILLSESQERMILAVKPEKLEEARTILARHDVRNAVIGRFTGKGKYCVIHAPEISEADLVASEPCLDGVELGFDVPYDLLSFRPDPIEPSPEPKPPVKATAWPTLDTQALAKAAPAILGDYAVQDQSLADSQYDSTVQGRRPYGPYSGSARRVRTAYWAAEVLEGKPMATLFTAAYTPEEFELHPVHAMRACLFANLTTLVAAGSKRRDIAFCDNFYTPHLSDDWSYWLVAMVDELAALVDRFGTPVISGKDSSAGSVKTAEGVVHVPPAAFLSSIGKVPSFDGLLPNDWQEAGSLIVRLGQSATSAAGSVAGRALGLEANDLDAPDVERFAKFIEALETADRTGWRSAMPIGSGGILATVAMRSLGSGLEIELSGVAAQDLLAESKTGLLLEIDPAKLDELPPDLEAKPIGRLTSGGTSVKWDGVELLTPDAIRAWETSFGDGLK